MKVIKANEDELVDKILDQLPKDYKLETSIEDILEELKNKDEYIVTSDKVIRLKNKVEVHQIYITIKPQERGKDFKINIDI